MVLIPNWPEISILHSFEKLYSAKSQLPFQVGQDHKFEEIARGDPQKPQTFYPMRKFVKMQPGDFMVARCTYNATGVYHDTRIGKLTYNTNIG